MTAIVIDHHGMQLKPLMWEVALFINLTHYLMKIANFKVCISASNYSEIVWDGPDGTSFKILENNLLICFLQPWLLPEPRSDFSKVTAPVDNLLFGQINDHQRIVI